MFVTREMALWEVLRVSPLEEHPFCGDYPGLLWDLLLSPLQLTVIFLRSHQLSLVLCMLPDWLRDTQHSPCLNLSNTGNVDVKYHIQLWVKGLRACTFLNSVLCPLP